jgi:hypothetical protein
MRTKIRASHFPGNENLRITPAPARSVPLVLTVFLAISAVTACRGRGGISDLPTPTAGAPGVVLQWFRSGGVAGFCDELTVTSDGLARLGDCKNPALAEAGLRPLPAEQWAQLKSWLATVDSYNEVQSDGEAADAMTVSVVFNGDGVAAAEEPDKEALRGFAAGVHAGMLRLAEAGCTVTAIADSDIYEHPDWDAPLIGSLADGEIQSPEVQTADGWLGFDPGGAQAGGTPLRWLAPNAQVTREPGCEVLPRFTGNPPAAGRPRAVS